MEVNSTQLYVNQMSQIRVCCAVLCCAVTDCDQGSLSSYLAQWPAPYEGTEPGSMLRVLQLLQDTAQGLDELHREHVVHGDLVSWQVLCWRP
jgi:hypothetical protein